MFESGFPQCPGISGRPGKVLEFDYLEKCPGKVLEFKHFAKMSRKCP
jgi:hypothetical protein